jgi:hypothetical protein
MKTRNKKCNGGFTIELSPISRIILSATSTGGNKISLNDTVVSSGRVFCPKDVRGRVIEIDEPFAKGSTDHIFLIDFGKPFGSYHMGFQDLLFEGGSYVFRKTVHTACIESRPYA